MVACGSGATEEVRITCLLDRMDIEEVTALHAGAKEIHPTPNNLMIERDSSAVSRSTAETVGQDKGWRQEKEMWGYDRKRQGDGMEKGGVHSGW